MRVWPFLKTHALSLHLGSASLGPGTWEESPDAPARAGVLTAARRGSVPERRLALDDTGLELVARSAAELVLEVRGRSAPLPGGASATEIVARGKPRLRAVVLLHDSAGEEPVGRIESLERLGAHGATGERP